MRLHLEALSRRSSSKVCQVPFCLLADAEKGNEGGVMWKCIVCGEVSNDLMKLKPHPREGFDVPYIRCKPMSIKEIYEYQEERRKDGEHIL